MISKILTILAALAEALRRLHRHQEQRDHARQSQQIQEDPAGWFDRHFSTKAGNSPDAKPDPERVHHPADLPGDAAGADQADSDDQPDTRRRNTTEPI